jgi:plasmid stability protein
MDTITFADAIRLRNLIDEQKGKLKIDAAKQHILITDDEINELAQKIKKAIKFGMKKVDVNPRIAQTIKDRKSVV